MSSYLSPTFTDKIFPMFVLETKMKPITAKRYLRECELISEYAEMDFLKLDKKTVQSYFDALAKGTIAMKDGTSYSADTVSIKYSYLRSVGTYIAENSDRFGITYYPPYGLVKVKAPEANLHTDRIVSIKDLRELFKNLKGTDAYFMACLAFYTGLSSKQLIDLKISDFGKDGEGKLFLSLPQSIVNHTFRDILIPDVFAEELEEYINKLPETQITLFTNTRKKPLTMKSLQRIVKSSFCVSSSAKPITLQMLRSNFAVYAAKGGATAEDIAEQLGIEERHVFRYSGLVLTGQASSFIEV